MSCGSFFEIVTVARRPLVRPAIPVARRRRHRSGRLPAACRRGADSVRLAICMS